MKKDHEVIRYIVFGILSAALNIGLFHILYNGGLDYRAANGITLVIVKLFSYLTNKFYVFGTPYVNLKQLLKEACSFFLARGATFILEFAGVIFMVEVLNCAAFPSKCIMALIVIAANYFLSKKLVFRKKE